MLRAGVDVGGTFTDIVTVDVTGRNLKIRKTPSTKNQADGICIGLTLDPDDLGVFIDISHGTTVATNILLEGTGAQTGLITTRGFRDTIEIGRCQRLAPGGLFNNKFVRPTPLVARQHRFEIDERIGADGRILAPLDVEGLKRLAGALKDAKIEAVAICFLNSYKNPAHELQAKEVLQRALPELFLCCSSEIVPRIREYERFSTTTVNCFVAPVMSRYMKSLGIQLRSRGYRRDVLTMASTGGLLSAEAVVAQPVRTVMSGPAAAVNGAIYFGRLAGRDRLIAYDMGGTSTDVCLIDKGEPLIVTNTVVAGMPISIPQIDIHSVGTGGGSIAWIDLDGRPRVGPRSAGSEPGPIAYAKGGAEITVTDANLLLGRLPKSILDGQMSLVTERVERAFDKLTKKIKYPGSREDLAEGLLRLAVTSMSGSVRKISIERGYDPRDFSIFAIGGAGPMHAAMVAEELGIREVIVPPLPGNISAFGHLVGELRYDAMKSFCAILDDFHKENGRGCLEDLAEETRRRFENEGISDSAIKTRYFADLRYVGQSYEITVPIARPFAISRVKADFVALYQKRYGHQHEEAIEFTALRTVSTVRRRVKIDLDPGADSDECPTCDRRVFFGGRWLKSKVIRRGRVVGQGGLNGPAIIEEYGATTVVPPGWKVRAGLSGCLFLSR
jgi:N-methylhydantoinase A